MYKQILLPYDGLPTGIPSVILALDVAARLGAEVNVLHIIDENTYTSTRKAIGLKAKQYAANRTEKVFDAVKEIAKKRKFKRCNYHIMFASRVITGVKQFAKKHKNDLCVIQPSPYSSPEIKDMARTMFRGLDIPVLFVQTNGAMKKEPVVLATVDERKENICNVRDAIEFVKATKGKLLLYHTTWENKEIQSDDVLDHCIPQVHECISLVKEWLEGVEHEWVVDMAETIHGGLIKCAIKNDVDLVFMTSSRSFVGGQPELVVDNSVYPVLLVRR